MLFQRLIPMRPSINPSMLKGLEMSWKERLLEGLDRSCFLAA